MTGWVDLNPNHLAIVLGILSEHVPECEVRVFGSRATWTAKDYSDLDLAVVGAGALDWRTLGRLKEAFEESSLPMRVDVLDWHATSESYREVIERDYVVVQEGTNRTVAGKRRDVPFAQLLEEPVRNGIYKKREFHGRGVKVVNMGELFANPRLRAVDMKRVELTESEQRRFGVQAGDLLFARRSLVAEGAGKCSVVLEANEFTTFESSIIRARPDPTKADSLFLYYYFNSPIGLHALDTIRRHVAVAGITGTDLAQLAVEMPPLAEQRAIARILGTLDDKIELNRRMNATLEAMARALFKSWFVDFDPVRAKMEGRWRRGESLPGLPAEHYDLFPDRLVPSELGEIPEGWEVKKIEEVAERVAMGPFGSSIKVSTFVNSGIPIISGQHLNGMLLSDNEYRFISKEHARNLANANVKRGDVVFTHAGSIGQVAYIPETSHFERYVISQRQFYMRCDISKTSPLFIVHFFKTPQGQHKLLANTSSTGVPSISRPVTYLRSIKLFVPPKALCSKFGEMVGTLHMRTGRNAIESRSLTDHRGTLLAKLVSGELRV